MHRITISVLSVFIVLPAFASARLPVVNVASGGVSARAAFGMENAAAVTVAPVKKADATRTKKVVARAAKPVALQPAADMGAQIVASNDVLVPQRPSADLWAKNDVALRMPKPSEFSVYRTDSQLPEERIDQTHTVAKTVAPAVKTRVASAMPEILPNWIEGNVQSDCAFGRFAKTCRRKCTYCIATCNCCANCTK